jgi:beta-phosphoglucomutase-like phosphatase (HAD superfamily)
LDKAIITFSAEEGKGIIPLPGVGRIIKEVRTRASSIPFTFSSSFIQLAEGQHLPNPCWAICTSATRPYASSALDIAGVPIPDVFITSEDVPKGKPL